MMSNSDVKTALQGTLATLMSQVNALVTDVVAAPPPAPAPAPVPPPPAPVPAPPPPAPAPSPAPSTVLPIQGGGVGVAGATGWQHTGVTLSAYSGSYTITGQANLVIDSKSLTDRLRLVNCSNFVIKRSKIAASGAATPDGQGNIQLEGTSWGLIEDVEITNGTTGQYDRNIATYNRSGASRGQVIIRRVWAHGGFRGMDITSDNNILVEDSYMGPSLFVGTGERSHTSAVRAAGSVFNWVNNNVVYHVGPESNGSGVIATYPENGVNHDITFNGGLWILEDQGGGAPYGIACGYTVGSEPQNLSYTIRDLYVSTEFYADGCPGGVGQHWNSGDTRIGALGGTKVWTNVRKYHPGFADHNQVINPD